MYSAWGGTDTAGVCLLLCPRAEQSTTPAAPVHLGDGTLALKGEKKEAINAPAIDRTLVFTCQISLKYFYFPMKSCEYKVLL